MMDRRGVTTSVLLGLGALAGAQANLLNVGKIVIDRYETAAWESNQRGPGAKITAHFEPNAAFASQTCCPREKLRWLQCLFANPGIPGVSPIPNRRIIDLRKDQNAPGHPNGKGDDLPFYDFTYPTLNDVQNNQNIKIDGSGVFMADVPRVAAGQTDLEASFTSLVVCIHEDQRLCVLGGFRWGFKINDRGVSTLTPWAEVRKDEVWGSRFNEFNTPMKEDFPGWGVLNQRSCCPESMIWMNTVPEPVSLLALGAGVFGLGLRNRKKGLRRAS